MEIYSDVNLKGNSLIDFVIDNRVSDPTGISGKVYYNASTSLLRYFDTSWKNIASENFVTTGLANKLDLVGGDLTGINGAGFHGFIAQATKPSTPTSGFRIYSNNSHAFSWIGQNGFTRTFDGLSNTADRTYTLPDISGTLTIGTGANGQVAFWTGSNVLSSDSNLFWNNTTKRLGVGTITPRAPIEISGDGLAQAGFGLLGINSTTRLAAFVFRENGGLKAWMGYGNNGDLLTATGYVDGSFVIRSESNLYFGANGNNLAMTVRSSGVTIGSSGVDAGFRLDVNGTVRVQNQLLNVYNSTASTPATLLNGAWFTGGTSVTNKPHFLIEPSGATSTGWNTNGTGIGVNAASGFTGNLLDLHINGASQFRVALNAVVTSGQFTAGTTIASGGPMISGGNYNLPNAYKVNWGGGLTFLEGTDTYFRVQVNGVERWRTSSNGNFLFNTTTDAGFRFDVAGSFRARTGSDSAIEYNYGFLYHGGNYWQYVSSDGYNFGTRNTTHSLIFRTNNIERLRVNAIGEVFTSSLNVFSNSSGTTPNSAFQIANTINNTDTYSGIFRGIFYNPTLTSLTGTTHRAIETVAGDVVIGSTSGNLLVGTTTSAGFRVDVNGSFRATSITNSSMTQGSVLFAGENGLIEQDNTNFFWDNINKKLEVFKLYTGNADYYFENDPYTTSNNNLKIGGVAHQYGISVNQTNGGMDWTFFKESGDASGNRTPIIADRRVLPDQEIAYHQYSAHNGVDSIYDKKSIAAVVKATPSSNSTLGNMKGTYTIVTANNNGFNVSPLTIDVLISEQKTAFNAPVNITTNDLTKTVNIFGNLVSSTGLFSNQLELSTGGVVYNQYINGEWRLKRGGSSFDVLKVKESTRPVVVQGGSTHLPLYIYTDAGGAGFTTSESVLSGLYMGATSGLFLVNDNEIFRFDVAAGSRLGVNTGSGNNATFDVRGSTSSVRAFLVKDNNSVELLRVDNGGNVIINPTTSSTLIGSTTDAGTGKLQVTGNAHITGTLRIGTITNQNTRISDNSILFSRIVDGTYLGGLTYDAANQILNISGGGVTGGITLSNNAIEIMRLTNDSRVVIGATSATFKFQIEETVNGNGGIFVRNQNTGSSAFGGINVATGPIGSTLTTSIRTHSALHTTWPSMGGLFTDSFTTGGMVLFNSSSGNTQFWTNGSRRMDIVGATGNVLIGTSTDAGFRLDVNGSLRSSGSITCGGNILLTGSTRVDWGAGVTTITGSTAFMSFNVNSAERFRINNTGSFLIGTDINISSSILTLESTTRGFLPPRMTTAQINSIASPANGLLVYNTTIDYLCGYQAGAWVKYSHSPM